MTAPLVAATLAALALQGAPGAKERAAHERAGLPRCAAVAPAPPADWKRVVLREGFSVALPACFEKPAEQPRYMHGGESWRCHDAVVDVAWGMWGQSSFADGQQRCATEIGGLPVVLFTSADEVKAWFLTGTVHEPVVAVWSKKPDELRRLQSVFASARLERSHTP